MGRGTRRLRVLAPVGVALALLVAAAWVWTSINGRGGRAPEGERRVVTTEAGREIVYWVRPPREGDRRPRPVVLKASFARSVADFNELTAALAAEGFETLAIESRGIGGSGGGGPGQRLTLHDLAADIGVVLDLHRGEPIPTAHLVGHAFGNRVVRTWARDAPERVASLVLIAAGGLVPLDPEVSAALERTVAAWWPWPWREAAVRKAFFAEESAIPPDWRGGWWLWGGLAQGAATTATPSSAFWDGGRAPILVLQAEQDSVAPPEDAGLRLLASFPERVELVRVPGAGHAFLPEQPERVHRAVLGFLRRQEASTTGGFDSRTLRRQDASTAGGSPGRPPGGSA